MLFRDILMAAAQRGGGGAGAVTDPNFASVVFLSGFEGTNGSTTITDESGAPHTMTANGTAQIATAQKKYGTSSLSLPAAADSVTTPDSANWDLGAGSFTIEGFVRFASAPGSIFIIHQYLTTGNQRSWAVRLVSGALEFHGSSDGTGLGVAVLASGAWSPSTDTWYHICVDFDGTTYRAYVDGAMVGSGTSTITIFNGTGNLGIGARSSDGPVGFIDEVRITKGVARYASDGGFTVPAAAFPRS